MIEDVIREMFEEWAAFHKFKLEKDKKVTDDYGVIYANPMTQGAWMAWNGAMDVAGSCVQLLSSGYTGEQIH